jgi:hypothetical protein
MRLEIVPQQGHAAIGHVARRVMVISAATWTCLITTSERSGKIVMMGNLEDEKWVGERKVVLLQSITFLISEVDTAGESFSAASGWQCKKRVWISITLKAHMPQRDAECINNRIFCWAHTWFMRVH